MIEILSIHIPKTAGQTFKKILEEIYTDKLDPRHRRKDFFPHETKPRKLLKSIPPGITVLHGHLFYQHVKPIHRRDKAKIITWLREPVERLISNYYYLMRQIRNNPKHQHADKIDYSLIEYAKIDVVRNRMHRYLEGLTLNNLFFYGFTESFTKDITFLSKLLEWPCIPSIEKINDGTKYKNNPDCTTREVTGKMRETIRDLNRKDMALYEKAKNLRIKSGKP